MGRVDVRSDIPEQHPHKRGVEEVFREVLGSAGGSWTVVIYLIHGIFWTVFVIRDSDGFRRVLLVDDPREQQPEFFASSLRALVEEARFWRAPDPVPDFPGSPCAISPQGSWASRRLS